MLQNIREQIKSSIAVKQAALADDHLLGQVANLSQEILVALKRGNKVFFAGNGGSFADAQHLAAEFTSRFRFDRAPLPAIVLGANASSMSAIGNDYGYEQVFARELKGLAKQGDIFLAISTSGNSPSIISAIEAGRSLDIKTVLLTGASGGKAAELCESIRVPSSVTAHIQECHILFGHLICGIVEDRYFPRTVHN